MKISTEVVRASEIQEKVVNRIFKIRNPDALIGKEYEAALAAYEKDRRDLPEVTAFETSGLFKVEKRGFYRLVDGEPVFTARPRPLSPLAYRYRSYDKRLADSTGGTLGHAGEIGVLADSEHNRDIRPDRVSSYAEAMLDGLWQDLLSDPITITEDGQVVNGQHRIAAAAGAWGGKYEAKGETVLPPNDPTFMVIWGVNPDEAGLADGSRRTDHDRVVIASKARLLNM